ncbi:hypothetical protein [Cellulomonas sp. Leaf334]|uniref:hypothetical protein n=1 Tax=Cellulomonas sp. Leaf334 TaxID=1736339 RepID=UPI000B30CE8B
MPGRIEDYFDDRFWPQRTDLPDARSTSFRRLLPPESSPTMRTCQTPNADRARCTCGHATARPEPTTGLTAMTRTVPMPAPAALPDSVLLVEDDAGDRLLVQEVFDQQGLAQALASVEDGEAALDYLYRRGP